MINSTHYSPTNKKAFHFSAFRDDIDIKSKLTQLKRIASSDYKIQDQHNGNSKDYINRIMALNASNDHAYKEAIKNNGKSIDQAIQYELNFIRDQVETVKNDLKLCDSLSSGRQRSKNPSVMSFKTLDNMQQKLNCIYPSSSINSTPRAQKSFNKQYKRMLSENKTVHIQQKKQEQSNECLQSSKYYLFCLFTRLTNSNVISMIDKNKIRIKQEDKCGNQYNFKTYNLKNSVIVSIPEIQNVFYKNAHISNFMLIGGKSTSKKRVVDQLLQTIIQNESIKLVNVKYAIHGSIKNEHQGYFQLPYSLIQQPVNLYQCESRQLQDLQQKVIQLFQDSKQDPYYRIKQYLHDQIQINQDKLQRKMFMNLVSKDISCIKVISIHIQTYTYSAKYNIISTNYIQNSQNFIQMQNQSLSTQGEGEQFIIEAIENIDDENTVKLFCINPLRYRLQDSLKLLDLMLLKH